MRRSRKLIDSVRSRVKRWLMILTYPNVEIHASVELQQLAQIRASDGASISIGSGTTCARMTSLVCKYGILDIGTNTFIGQNSVIVARQKISIGDNVLIGEGVSIRDQDHAKSISARADIQSAFNTAAVFIGNDVWLGGKVTITKGVSIGKGAVIGANSVVTSDIPEGALAVGAPARIIHSEETVVSEKS